MTTTVKVLIEGNKECEVNVLNEDGSDCQPSRNVKPGTFTTVLIHGEQKLTVKEVGGFVS